MGGVVTRPVWTVEAFRPLQLSWFVHWFPLPKDLAGVTGEAFREQRQSVGGGSRACGFDVGEMMAPASVVK